MKSLKIAVLGGGHGGHMMAADFALKGHCVNFYEMPRFAANVQTVLDRQSIVVKGIINGEAKLNLATTDIDAAIANVEYICIVTPAFAHADYAQLLKDKVKKEQVIVVYPGAFAALRFRHVFGAENCPVIADVNNLPYDTRITAPGEITLYGRNDVNIGFLPASEGTKLIEEMREAMFPFVNVYKDVLECGLSIVNPAWHSGPCLLSASIIELPVFNFFIYEHGWTPSACKVNIMLDKERKSIGHALGYHLRPMEDFSGMPEDFTWQQLYAAGHGSISLTPICGPNSVHDRYLTEDCPYGLVPWASLAQALAVDTPVTDSVINIYNIIHETDWRQAGCTIKDLGLEGLNREQILNYVTTGVK